MIKKYREFINEAVVTFSLELKTELETILGLVNTKEEQDWVKEILNSLDKDVSNKKLINDDKYYFDVTKDDKYLSMEIKNDTRTTITPEFKIGKSLMLLVPNIPNHVLSSIVDAIKSLSSGNYDIKETNGDEIESLYNYDDVSENGTLGNSCMNDVSDNFFDIYVYNPDVVKLIYLKDDDDMLIARALLWLTDSGWVMDKVYYAEDKFQYVFKNYAKNKGYKTEAEDYMVQLDNAEHGEYPYIDTFSYICLNENQLCANDIFGITDEVISAQDTDGGYEAIRNHQPDYIELYSIDQYRGGSDISKFIGYSINNEAWLKDYINEEFERYYSDTREFLENYDYYIKDEFNKLGLHDIDDDINIDNFEEMITDWSQNYMSKFEEALMLVIEFRYRDYTWEEYYNEVYYEKLDYVSMDKREREYWDRLIQNYCSLDILNDNLRKLQESDYEEYQILIYHKWGIY